MNGLKTWIGLALGLAPPVGEDQRRDLAVARGALSALAARGLALLTNFLVVPLAVGYLGAERYGIWVAVSSALSWLMLADLGLGNELTTALAEAFGLGRADLERRHLATAFWMLSGIACALAVSAGVAWRFVDWPTLLGVRSPLARSEVGPALGLALCFFVLSFPLSVVERAYAAREEGATGNAWSVAGSVASLAAVYAATRTEGGLPILVVALSGTRFALLAANAGWLFHVRHPELHPGPSAVHRDSLRRLTGSGALYFVIQVAALVLFNTDNLIIAGVLGADRVTPYSVTWSLFSWPSLLMAMAFPYLWPAYTAALARRDHAWVRRTFRLSLLASLAFALVLVVPLVVFGEEVIRLWAGPAAVPPRALLPWMGAWSLVYAAMNPVACLLNAASRLKGQALWASLSAVANVGLSLAWARSFGLVGVIAATVLSYLALAAGPICLEAWRLLASLPREGQASGKLGA